MSVARIITDFLGCFGTIYILSLYCKAFFSAQNGNRLRNFALRGAAFAICLINALFIDNAAAKSGVCILLFSIFAYSYNSSHLKRIYSAMIAWIFINTCEIVTGVITITVLEIDITQIRSDDFLYALNVFSSKLLAYVGLQIILILTKKNRRSTDYGFSAALFTLFLFIIFHTAFFVGKVATDYSVGSNILALLSMILMGAATIAVIFLNNRQIKYVEQQIKIKELENQYKLQVKEFENLRDNARIANKNIHDVKNFTLAINSYLEQGRIDEARQKLNEYTERISYTSHRSSGSQTVDALLAVKEDEINKICKDAHISVVLGDAMLVDEIDLCILLGNAIDNAIEESRRIENASERMIEIRVLPNAGGLSIFIGNKTSVSSKATQINSKDSFFHGFGIENMKNICKKYNGDFQLSERDGYFRLSAFLPNVQAKQPNMQEALKTDFF